MAILHNKDLHGLKTNIPIHDPCLSTPHPSSLIPHPPSSPLTPPHPLSSPPTPPPTHNTPPSSPHPPQLTTPHHPLPPPPTVPHTHTHTHPPPPLALPFLSGKKWRVPCSWFWLGVGSWVCAEREGGGGRVRREGGDEVGEWEG